jgi:DNA-directed RNA polymerase specialized sigma24 family protein
LDVLFQELPWRQREVFDLVELQGFDAAHVAELLDIEPVTVRAHLFKARRRLRASILETRPELVEDFL